MSGNTKALRVRIKSVTATMGLTKAMGLVASSKIRRANLATQKAREYLASLKGAVSLLTSTDECAKSVFMRKGEGKTKIIVIAGDRGLAGGYNSNVFKLAKTFTDAEFIGIGKRACEKFSQEVVSSEQYGVNEAFSLSEKLCGEFENGEISRVGIIYTKYNSIMSQSAEIEWVLPLERAEKQSADAIFEPDSLTVLNSAVKEYVAGVLVSLIRESFLSEVTARRMAMDSAGKNAKEMIDELHLQYNRARQGAITQEITEIVAGSGN